MTLQITRRETLPIFFARYSAVVAAGLMLMLACSQSRAAEPEWKAGLAQVKITPGQPVPMSGYASRTKPFDKVEADIYAKALALEDSQGQRAVLVTSDLIGFAGAVAEPICERIGMQTGLKREEILLNSSHTHAGPALSVDAAAQEGEALRTVEYTKTMQAQVVDLVVRALADLKPARLSAGGGVANFVMNRREFTPKGIILGVNPRGLADRTVPILRVDTPEGKLRAVLFGAATHNTTLGGDNYRLCGDYAGFAQAFIDEKHPSATALFITGCAGDSNPYPRGTMELAREHGASLGQEVCRVLETKLRPIRGPLQVAFARAQLPLEAPVPRDELERRAAGKTRYFPSAAQQMLALLAKGETPPVKYTCPFAVWQFGEDLTLVGLPGEVVVDYALLLEKALGPNRLWVAGYCNDVFGYLPTARILEEGGYETRGLWTGSVGYFDPKAQDVVVDQVRDLAKKAGRKESVLP